MIKSLFLRESPPPIYLPTKVFPKKSLPDELETTKISSTSPNTEADIKVKKGSQV